jgi:hypothetical protein
MFPATFSACLNLHDKKEQLMLSAEICPVYHGSHKQYVNTMCDLDTYSFIIEADYTYA